MVMGNRPVISASLFAPGYTIASVIANEFTEATSDLYLSALIELGLILLLVSLIVIGMGRLMVVSFAERQREPDERNFHRAAAQLEQSLMDRHLRRFRRGRRNRFALDHGLHRPPGDQRDLAAVPYAPAAANRRTWRRRC